MFGLDPGLTLVLILCLLAACAFEFINGFHDTANAVATVIYTNSLKPMTAVIWSGICNFIGVYFGGIAVAMGIVHLLPNALLLDQSVSHIVALLSAVILTSILWNLGTWYFGLPCSSSHTLLGSIFGVGLAYSFISDTGVALNWGKVKDILLALLISPVIGFSLTMAMVALLKKVVKKKRKLFAEPSKKKAPPLGIRSLIILSSTFVSYTHGSNDGQKGVGLIMIILISLVPVHFALNHQKNPQDLLGHVNRLEASVMSIDSAKMGALDRSSFMVVEENIDKIQSMLTNQTDFKKLEKKEHYEIRKDIMVLSSEVNQIFVRHLDEREFYVSKDKKSAINKEIKEMTRFTEYSPWWVILLISVSLGLGTMIGWKNIVVTIGEKIGHSQLTYAQGFSSQIVTATTIGASSLLGLPVSTTHVLSSGVAGSMVAAKGLKNLRMKTVKSILIAWLVTLPVTIVVSGGLFLLIRLFL
jgi:PiT family inorganic phosphate transporter